MSAPLHMQSIFKPAFVLMSGRALGFAVSFAIPVVLARIFDQSEFGTYKQLFLIYATLYGVAQIGMAESLFYFLPTAACRAGGYALNAMLVMAVAGLICLMLLWGAGPTIAYWLNNRDLIGHLPLIGVFLLFMLTSSTLEIVLTARKQHLSAFWAYAFSDLWRATLCIVPVFWFGGLRGLLLGAIVFAALRLCATLWCLQREFNGALAPDARSLRNQLAYAGPFAIAVFIEALQSNLHLYAVSYRFDAATFAIYAVGCLQIPLIDCMMMSTANVMMVRMREDLQKGQEAHALSIWRDTTRKLAMALIPLLGGLLVIAQELIVSLFTRSYAPSVPIFMLWTVSILFSTPLTDAVLRVYAQTRFLILLNLVRLVLVAGLINGFLARFGLLGAVAVTLLATVVAKALALGRIKTVMRSSLSQLLPWRDLAATITLAAAAALPALLVKSVLAISNAPLMLTTASVYAGSYLILLLLWGPLSAGERLALLRWAQRPVAGMHRS